MKRLSVLFAIILLTVAMILTLGSCSKYIHFKHTPGEAVRENEISAACTSNGSYDEVIRCSECGKELSRVTKTLEKTGHALSEFTSDNNATCTQNATQTKSCKNPGCSYKETEEVPDSALDHESQMVEFSGEYCGDNPVAKVICGICQTLIAEYGHTYEKSVIPATCLENGKNVYTCKKCGDSYTETFPASGHISGTWVTVTPPTCTDLGTAEKECMVCGEHYDSKKIEVLPHTYTSKLTESGMLYTCRECEHSYTDSVNLPIYHITFNENGGDEVEDMSVLEHATPDIPITHRDGYIFIGWFVDEALTESYTGSTVESDLTLYAGWQEPEIIEDEEDIVTDAPTDYTFTVVSDTVLNDGNIGNYVSIKTLGGEEIKPRIVSKNNSAYTIGADYKNGENYFITLTGISFEGKETKELWIKTEGEKENEIVLKNGVTAVSLDDIFGIYENNKDMLMMAYNDILAVGNTYAFYEGADDAYRFGVKIKSKDTLEGYTVYTAEFLTVDDIFEVCDLSESEKVNFNNAEINANLKSDIAAVFEKSPVYSQYKSAVQAVSKTYDSTVKGINLDVNFSTLGEKFLIKFSAVANLDSGVAFIMNYIIELKINFDFALNGSNSTLILNSNMKNTVELNVAFDGEEAHGTTAFNKAALLREYRSIFNEIKEKNMELSPENAQTKPDPKAFELATIPIQIGPVTAYIAIMGEFDFSMMGGLSTEFVQTVDCRIGMQNGKFAKDYKAKLEYFSGCGYTITDIYGGIGVKLDVGFCGLYGYIKGSIGVRGELSGAAAFAIADDKSFVLGNYHFTSEVLIDASVGVNYVIRMFGYEKILLDESLNLVEKDIPFITLGDDILTLHFTDDSYTSADSPLDLGKISCGKTDVSTKIDTSVLVIDANTLRPSTHSLTCEYVVKVTSGNVRAAISTQGILTLKGEGNFTLAVTVKHGDVVEKTIYIKGSSEHDVSGKCEYCELSAFSEGLAYKSNGNGTCYVRGIGTCTDTNVVIPAEAPNGEKVTAIGSSAFRDCTSLTSVVIGNSVTEIGDQAFYYCTGLTSVVIPDSVTKIGDNAFEYCDSLTSVVIPDSVTKIGVEAFAYCDSLTSVEIPDSVTWIGVEAFSDCKNLTSITVSDENTAYKSIDGNLYTKDGKTLVQYAIGKTDTSFTIPDSVTSIGSYAFSGCSNLTSVVIGDSVTKVSSSAFYNCTKLTSVKIGDSITMIGGSAFSGCSSLTSVVIPDSVTEIGWNAFEDCSGLTSVVIGDSVKWIGSSAFEWCKNLTSVVIPDSVTEIGDWAFRNCSSLTSVVIGNGVTTIGKQAFCGCSGLTSVVIPDSVTRVGDYAFENCTSLTSIVIGDSVKWIGDYAFHGCYKLVEIISSFNITPGTTANGYVGYYAKEVHTGDSKIVNKDGYLFYTYDGIHYLLGYIGSDTELILPENYNGDPYEIYMCAFSGCDSLTSVVIPDSVTRVDNYAFEYCSSLTSVVIGDSVTSIGKYAFYDCSSLTSIVIPDSVTSIGDWVFADCRSLTSVVIPDSVTSIGKGAFHSCTSLTSIVIGDSVTSIGNYAFYGCSSLTSVVIPDSVTEIGERAFYNCTKLTSIKYRGTKEQWNKISKGSDWNYNTGNYTITYNYDGE